LLPSSSPNETLTSNSSPRSSKHSSLSFQTSQSPLSLSLSVTEDELLRELRIIGCLFEGLQINCRGNCLDHKVH
ncbi:hypothetical protein GIB67_027281, partial [Kingdonia uniflora]